MNRNYRTISALLNTHWCIEEVWAEQHLPLIQSYLSGSYPMPTAEESAKAMADLLAEKTFALSASADGSYSIQNRHALSDENLPDNSVFVLDMRGPVFKESNCCMVGSEEYTRLIRKAYAHEKIIGCVALIDSPGGQLSGTPTLYDAVRDPIKPFGFVVNEGLMASAAYWLASGSDFIYATQKSDQIGSIGVFVGFDDDTEARKKMGIKRIEVYSDRSPQKNRPMREARNGNTEPLREDINYAADLFREAVEQGRGSKLKNGKKGSADDVFEGGLFYASKAIELGLIDGFGTLETAVAKVAELASAPKGEPVDDLPGEDDENDSEPVVIPDEGDPTASLTQETTPQSNLNPTDMSLFGNKLKALTGLAGVPGAEITDAQLNAANAELDTEKIAGVRVISTAYLDEANASVAALNAANTQVATLTRERDDARAEAAKFGSQPGVVPTKSEKVDEKLTSEEATTYISETDAQLAKMRAQLQ